MVKTASLYDNFCKTGNYVIDDIKIWVKDGNCKKRLERILVLVCSTKTAEKNSAQTNRQTNKQTDRHYENNGHLAVNQ